MSGGTAHRGQGFGRWRIAGWGAVAAILLLPLLAMQVTDAVDWTPFDFAFAATVLVGAGAICELAAKRSGSRAYRAAVAVAVAAALLLVWINGAVGLIGSEDNPANLMFGGVLVVAFAGAALARLRPRGMARAMVATALAQGLVPIAVVGAATGEAGEVAALTTFFAALWLISAALFRTAGKLREI